ncbi:MAG: ATP-dependent DNA helicase RecG [Bacilli bacterium]
MTELNSIKGIGKKSILTLNKLGIYNINDLITYYPFRYNFLKKMNLSEVDDGDNITINGIVESNPNIIYFKGKMNKMSFRVKTDNNIINIVIFNRAFLKNNIQIDKNIIIIGKWDLKRNTVTASDIRLGKLNEDIIEPIYHIATGISSRVLSNFINNALLNINIEEILPSYLVDKYSFLGRKESIKLIHNPKNINDIKKSQIRLKYEELFLFMMKINYLKLKNEKENIGLSRNIRLKDINNYIASLPFELTLDQHIIIKEIINDLNNKIRMNRLIQGDVGSGKTVVAVISIYANYLSGYQSALMAPTEVLAMQHFNTIKKLLSNTNMKIELLLGSTKIKDKKDIYERLEKGKIDLIIGTHALIQDDVKYNNLGLVITDEQHRFGVNQRANLRNKGMMPDILYLSATPIPRTYALTIYGDMDLSTIKTMPKGRKDIITKVKNIKEIKDILIHMYEELKSNHQIYIIAPLIEESEKIDLSNVYELEEKFNTAFKNQFKIDILHGKMTKEEKDNVITNFKDNKTNILISTTVIEVGIDIPNATMMVIFDADRFGLSTLHQLRGRVGRSDIQSYCYLIGDKDKKRLEIMEQTNDGFEISEEDFKLRGEGDLFGVKQSGDMVFKIANIKNDFKILIQAKEDSLLYLKENIDNISNIDKYLKNEVKKVDNLD